MMKSIRAYLALIMMMISGVQLSAQDGKDEALSNLGASSAMLMYNTYGYLGVLADATTKDLYESSYTADLADEQISSISNLIESYTALLNTTFVSESADREYLQSVIKCLSYLKEEAAAIKKFVQTKSAADYEQFDQSRKSAWTLIEELLNLKTESADD